MKTVVGGSSVNLVFVFPTKAVRMTTNVPSVKSAPIVSVLQTLDFVVVMMTVARILFVMMVVA